MCEKGWVAAKKGQYHDALFVKRNRVVPMIIETLGGITPHARRAVRHLEHRVRAKARDGTKYGTSRTSTKNFYYHHIQRLSVAAVMSNAKAMHKAIGQRKRQLALGRAAAGGRA